MFDRVLGVFMMVYGPWWFMVFDRSLSDLRCFVVVSGFAQRISWWFL